MARSREFDRNEALDKAMRLFWRKGYAETSVRDLVEHTGVAHAGLYSAFGGKRELYQAALDLYDATYGNFLLGPMEEPDAGRAAIEHFFETILYAVKTKQFGDGCFMCNTAVEFGNEGEDIVSKSRENLERMNSAFQNALRNAHVRGEVRQDLELGAAASLLTSTFHGVAVQSRAKVPFKQVENAVRMALQLLG
jgi:AcrR family transcriptional regulator